jgi:hypothetical protein
MTSCQGDSHAGLRWKTGLDVMGVQLGVRGATQTLRTWALRAELALG